MADWEYTPDQEEVHAYTDNLAERFFEKLRGQPELFSLAMTHLCAEPHSYFSTKGILSQIGGQKNEPFSAEQKREILQMLRDSALEVRGAKAPDKQDSVGATAHHVLCSVAQEFISTEYSNLITDEQQQHDRLNQYFTAIGLGAITKYEISLKEKKNLARVLLSQGKKRSFGISPEVAEDSIQYQIEHVEKDLSADGFRVKFIFSSLKRGSGYQTMMDTVLILQEVQRALQSKYLDEQVTFETGVFTCPDGIDLSFLHKNPQPNLFKTAAIHACGYVRNEGFFYPAITRENTIYARAETVARALEIRLSHMLYCKMVSCLSDAELTNLSPDQRFRVIDGLEGRSPPQDPLPFRDYHPLQAEQLARVADTIPADPALTQVFNAAAQEVAGQNFLARVNNWAQMPCDRQVAAIRGIVADMDRAFQTAAQAAGDSEIFTPKNAPVLAIGRGYSEIFLDGLDPRTNKRKEVVLNFPYKPDYDRNLGVSIQGYKNAVFWHYGTQSRASAIGSFAPIWDTYDFNTYICDPSQPLGEIIFCPRSVENNRRDPNPFWNYARPEDVLSDIVHRYHRALTLRFWRVSPSADNPLQEGIDRYAGWMQDAYVLRTRISYPAVEAWNECVWQKENPPEILRRLMKNPLDDMRTNLLEAALSIK